MASVRVRRETGRLFFDLRYRGIRCREQTTLPDTPQNRRRLKAVLERMQAEMVLGTFEYRRWFPDSPYAARFEREQLQELDARTAPKFRAQRGFV